MKKRATIQHVVGIVFLGVALFGFYYARALAQQHVQGFMMPIYIMQALLLGAGLAMIGALRDEIPPATCGVAIAGALYVYVIGAWHYALSQQGDAIILFPAEQGRVLFGACTALFVLGVVRLRREKSKPVTVEALVQGLTLLALVLLASLLTTLNRKFYEIGIWSKSQPATQSLMNLSWVACLFLLPLLKRGKRFAGWVLLIFGVPLLLLLACMTYTPLNAMAYAEDAEGALRVLRFLYSRMGGQFQIFAMLAVSGLYCLLPAPRGAGHL